MARGVDLRAAAPRIGTPEPLGTFPSVVAMDLAPSGDRFLALVPEREGVGAVTIVPVLAFGDVGHALTADRPEVLSSPDGPGHRPADGHADPQGAEVSQLCIE